MRSKNLISEGECWYVIKFHIMSIKILRLILSKLKTMLHLTAYNFMPNLIIWKLIIYIY